jgi:glucosylceramidase
MPGTRTTCAAFAVAILTAMTACADPPAVRTFVSSRDGARLSPGPQGAIAPVPGCGRATFQIDEERRHQTIVGFGASFLESGLICINALAPPEQERVFQALFDPAGGAGFSAMKTPLAGTDFMAAGSWYTYDDTPGDVSLEHFSIARDLRPDGLVTFTKRARKHGTFVLQAPMDYPPDWMLTTVEDRRHQDVRDRYFDALARYYLCYLQEYRKQGITIDYLSLFNEPGIYTKISYARIRDLIKHHVGPMLERSGLPTRLMLSEAPTRAAAEEGYPTVLDDPGARRFVAALPYHGYGFKDFDRIVRLHAKYPDLPLWMTEVCHAYEAGTPTTMTLPRTDFEDGAFWGEQIVSDLEAGASAWIYWNMVLDQGGGPWLVSPVHGNPDPNVQHPLVIIDRMTKQVTYTGAYWYLAHFSKFVRPGAVRVDTIGQAEGVRCVAFRTPEGRLIVQLLNRRDRHADIVLAVRGGSLPLRLDPISITTAIVEPAR